MDTLIFEFTYGFKGINGQHWFELNFLLFSITLQHVNFQVYPIFSTYPTHTTTFQLNRM